MSIGNFLSALVQRGREAELGAGTGAREGEAERFKRGRLEAGDKRQSELDILNRALVNSQIGRNKDAGTASRAAAGRTPKGFAPRNPNEIGKEITDRIDVLFGGALQSPAIAEQAKVMRVSVEEVAIQKVMENVANDPVLGRHASGPSPRVNLNTIRAAAERHAFRNRPSAMERQTIAITQALAALQGGGTVGGDPLAGGGAPPPGDIDPLAGFDIDPSTGKVIVSAAKKAEMLAAGVTEEAFDQDFMVGTQ